MSHPLAIQLPLEELCRVAEEAGVLKIMADLKCRSVTIDYLPARPAILQARLEEDDRLEALPLKPISIRFTLEDAMFGGVCFVALTCGHRVVVNPFVWSSYDALAKIKLTAAR